MPALYSYDLCAPVPPIIWRSLKDTASDINMEFEGDEAKALSNLDKHSVSFENVKIMSKTPSYSVQNIDDDLLDEYRFDYRNAKPKRFAARGEGKNVTVVVLDEDVAEVLKTPEISE